MKIALTAVVVAFSVLAVTGADQITAAPQTSSSQVELRFLLTALAKDKSAALLQETALSVHVDNAAGQVKSVRSVKDDPLRFAILVDMSKSDADDANSVKNAAFELFQGLASAQDQGYLVMFDHEVSTTERPVSVPEVKKALDSAQFRGGTAVYDAIEMTCRHRLSRSGNPLIARRVIFLISDGEDNLSHATRKEAEQAALEEGVSVFSVMTTHRGGLYRGEKFLQEVSQITGGFATDTDLRKAVPLLLHVIRAQWAVSVVPTQAADRKLHSIEVKCAQKGIQISAPSSVLFE